MEAATTHLLTALYALAHGLALTGEDGAEVERHRAGLRPELWRETKRFLREADRGPDGTTLDLGFLPLVLRWLGVASEDAFAAEFGVRVAEAIEHDRGRLDEIAGALQSPGAPGSEELGVHVTVAWSSQGGMVLMQARPQEGSAAVEALERAVGHYPWEDDAQYRQLLESAAPRVRGVRRPGASGNRPPATPDRRPRGRVPGRAARRALRRGAGPVDPVVHHP